MSPGIRAWKIAGAPAIPFPGWVTACPATGICYQPYSPICRPPCCGRAALQSAERSPAWPRNPPCVPHLHSCRSTLEPTRSASISPYPARITAAPYRAQAEVRWTYGLGAHLPAHCLMSGLTQWTWCCWTLSTLTRKDTTRLEYLCPTIFKSMIFR